jgi:hypothetical protein
MKWYKYLLVLFILSGVSNIIVGISTMVGGHYIEGGAAYAELVYDMYPALKPIDVIYGLYAIAMGIYVFVVRSALKGFKKSAPKMITILYTISLISYLVYNITTASIVGVDAVSLITDIIMQIVVNLIMIFANKAYFKTREELFIN